MWEVIADVTDTVWQQGLLIFQRTPEDLEHLLNEINGYLAEHYGGA